MANVKISQLTPKGANLEATDLLEISEFDGSGYVTKSVTGQDIIDAAAGGGVTDVTATSPLASSGGTTPDISIPQADAGSDGYLTSTDYISFTNKQDALVSATNIKTINGSSVLGSGDLTISGGGGGIHSQVKLTSGKQTNLSINASGTNSVAMAANRLFSLPYIPAQTFTCQNLYINVAVAQAASNCRILIYSDLNGIPDQKLYESANLDSSTVGIKTATTTFTFNQATTYWLAIHSSSNPTLTALGVAQLVPITMTSSISTVCGYNGNATFGSAPTTFPSVINQTGTTPCVFITVA